MSIRRTARFALAAVLAVAALAGCATIPRTGPVTEGGSVSSQDNGFGQIAYHPSGPVAGESQEEVLRGFIDAAVSPDNGYQIAREFLSDDFAGQWNPDASVTVDQEAQRDDPSRINSTSLSLAINPVAYVDQNGNYLAAGSQTAIPLQYTFVKEDGQWRIAKAPDGIVIDRTRFSTVFGPQSLYFYSPDFRYLVPDERWFPATRASISTRIVKALLAGPSPWLQGAVATAFPNGSRLASGSVPTQNGTAQVDLNSAAASADTTTVDRMAEQLSESLGSTAAVTGVDLTIGGVDRDASTSTGASHDPAVNANPLALAGGKFGFVSGKTISSLATIGTRVAVLNPTAATVSADASAAAVLTGDGVYAVSSTQATPVRVDSRSGLVAPSLDDHDTVWSTTSDPQAPIAVSAPDGATATLQPAWPDARTLVSFAVSRDGTRLAALIRTTDGQSHVMVAGIVRDSSGHPQRLGEPVDLGNVGLTEGLSLAWTDELHVAVLGTSPQGGTAIVTQEVGGTSSTAPGPAGGVVIAGGNPSTQQWVLTSSGALQTPGGNGWQTALDGVRMLAVQQGRS